MTTRITKVIIEQAIEGDNDAFGKLYDVYYDRILNYAFRRVQDRAVAEDITSCVFIKVARKINTFVVVHENSFNGWIFRIASNEVNQYFRKISRYKSVDLADYEDKLKDDSKRSVEQELSLKQDFVKVNNYIRQLKPKQQTIIDLYYFEGLPHRAIAEALNMKEGAVRTNLYRSISTLRLKLEKEGVSL